MKEEKISNKKLYPIMPQQMNALNLLTQELRNKETTYQMHKIRIHDQTAHFRHDAAFRSKHRNDDCC